MPRGSRWIRLVAVALLGLTACTNAGAEPGPATTSVPTSSATPPTSPATPSPTAAETPFPVVRIAVIEDLSLENPLGRMIPAFQGLRLAFNRAEVSGDLPVKVELVGRDIADGTAAAVEIGREIAADPEVVGVVVLPFVDEPIELGRILDEAGVPTVSLSALRAVLADQGWTSWLRAVPNQAEQAQALASFAASLRAARRGVCVAGDGSVSSNGVTARVERTLGEQVALAETIPPDGTRAADLAQRVGQSGCGVLLWGGFSTAAVQLRLAMDVAGLSNVLLLGTDAVKDDVFLSTAGPAGADTIVSCPCVDLSTSTQLRAQRFVQDYQSRYGLPPSIYSAEGLDVGRMLVSAFRSGARTRDQVSSYLRGMPQFDGLARTYVFGLDGELAEAAVSVRFFRDEGGRWIPQEQA